MSIQPLEHRKTEIGAYSNIKKYFFAGIALECFFQTFYTKAPDFQLNLPGRVYQLVKGFRSINTSINQPFGRFCALAVTIPFVEEFLFRDLLQEKLLKKIPHAFLHRFFPAKESLANNMLAAAARIASSAALFALVHAAAPEYPYNSALYLGHKFTIGVCCGIIQEMTENLHLSVAFHAGGNLIPAL